MEDPFREVRKPKYILLRLYYWIKIRIEIILWRIGDWFHKIAKLLN